MKVFDPPGRYSTKEAIGRQHGSGVEKIKERMGGVYKRELKKSSYWKCLNYWNQ